MRVPSFGLRFIVSSAVALSAALALGACSSGSSTPDTTGDGGHGGGSSSGSGSSSSTSIILLPQKDAGSDASLRDASVAHDSGSAADVEQPPTDAELNTYPGYAPPAPQVQNGGGPVLTHPIFIPVLFAGDALETQITAFDDALGPSMYWATATTEYGVGAGKSVAPIIVNETLPTVIDDSQMQTWLATKIGTDPRFGALGESVFDAGPFDAGSFDATAPFSDAASPTAKPPTNAIYMLYLPEGTEVTMDGAHSCSNGGFGGYHGNFSYPGNGANIVYAMLPRCGGGPKMDVLTSTVSHELVEAATDPYAEQPAFSSVDANHFFWEILFTGGEVADMCEDFPGAYYHPAETSMSAYLVQRVWSNKAALAGQDPCVPGLTAAEEPVYFNAFPNVGQVVAQYNGFQFPTYGVTIASGQQATIELDLFSNASTKGQEWSVSVIDGNSYFFGGTPDLTFSTDGNPLYGTNGDKLNVTITNTGTDGQGARPFVVINSLGATQTWWIGVVTSN